MPRAGRAEIKRTDHDQRQLLEQLAMLIRHEATDHASTVLTPAARATPRKLRRHLAFMERVFDSDAHRRYSPVRT